MKENDLLQQNLELSELVSNLADENDMLKAIISNKQWEATEFEKDFFMNEYKSLSEQNKVLQIEIQALKDSRDMYQNRNDILIRDINTLKNKLNQK